MKAIVHTRYGGPEVLQIEERDPPRPGADQVLVRVRAASVNDWDWGRIRGEPFNRLMNGLFAPKGRIPGSDIAGEVAPGGNAASFTPGARVHGDLCMAGFGGFAEYVCAPVDCLTRMPDGMSFEQAAALPQAGMLAVQGLIGAGGIGNGTRLLLNGAGGGVGTIALQLARAFDDVQITCVDSAAKLEPLRRLGADQVIDYQHEDFTRTGQAWDLILDTKTNRPPSDYLRALAPGGRYVTVGGALRRLAQIQLSGRRLARRHGRQLRIVALEPNRDLAFLDQEFEAGRLLPVLDRVYELADAREAMHRFVRAGHLGKIVIRMP